MAIPAFPEVLRLDAAHHSFGVKMLITQKAAIVQPTLMRTVLELRMSLFQLNGGR